MSPKLNFKIIGQGKPIIILHGLFGMLDNWLNMAKRLEDAGHMVVLVDQRDHGRSEHTNDFSFPLLADDLLHFMEENWKKYIGGHQDVFDALFSVDITHLQSRNEAESVMMTKLHDFGTVQFLMKNLTRKKEGGFEWKMNLPLLFAKYENILEGIVFSQPCLTETYFIRGEKSNYILDDDMGDILNVIPNSQFITIPDAGHWIHVDNPNELFNQINDFIRH